MMRVKDIPHVKQPWKEWKIIGGSQSDPLEWSVRHFLKRVSVGSLSKFLASCSILTEIRMCLAGIVN